jgi:hypothetical protein
MPSTALGFQDLHSSTGFGEEPVVFSLLPPDLHRSVPSVSKIPDRFTVPMEKARATQIDLLENTS